MNLDQSALNSSQGTVLNSTGMVAGNQTVSKLVSLRIC
jgi:hypothetical protein